MSPQVDGQSLTEVTHEKAVGILKSTDNIVELRVARQNLEDLHPYILPPSVEAIATSPAMLPAPPRGFGDEPCLDKDLKLSALPPPSDGLLADSRHPLCRNGMDLGTPGMCVVVLVLLSARQRIKGIKQSDHQCFNIMVSVANKNNNIIFWPANASKVLNIDTFRPGDAKRPFGHLVC